MTTVSSGGSTQGNMATFTTTGNIPLNMGDPINFGSLMDSDQLGGTSATAFTRRNAATGEQWSFTGTSFGNYSDGMPNSGTITSITYTSGANSVTITNFSLPAGQMLNLLIGGNWNQIIIDLLVGADNATGTALNDTLVGHAGNDTLNGGDGNDRIGGGAGNDIMNGGAGDDTFETLLFQENTGIDTIDGGDGNDVLWLSRTGSTPFVFNMDGANTATGVTLSDGTVIRNVEGFRVAAGSGNDTLSVAMFAPSFGCAFYGGDGIDTFEINLSSATESFHWVGSMPFQIGNVGGYELYPDVERLVATTGSGADFIRGAYGDDVLSTGSGNDELLGDAGNDTLMGGAGNDLIHGGNYFTTVADGFDVASYADATSAVTVSLLLQGQQQQTFGAGLDSLNEIDGLIGSIYNDTLTGDSNVNSLRGGAGNDTLNAGAGTDALHGEAGDDTIFWDADDGMTNVTGGEGVDIFVFSGAVAPTTFNLVAQGFETAQGRTTDVSSANLWNTQTMFYDSAWRADYFVTVNDNGSYSQLDYDQLNAFSWTTNFNEYDSSARLDVNVTVFDNGVTSAYDYDQASAFNWVSNWNQYNAAAALDINVTVFDNGTQTSNDFDADSMFNWTSNWISLDALGQLDLNNTVFDNGVQSAYDFDQADAFVWSSNWNQYAAGGALDINVTVFDDGTSNSNDFDEANAFDWASNFNSYNSTGEIDYNIVTFDNGNYAVLDYDQDEAFAWSTIWRLYNSGGTLLGEVITPDGP